MNAEELYKFYTNLSLIMSATVDDARRLVAEFNEEGEEEEGEEGDEDESGEKLAFFQTLFDHLPSATVTSTDAVNASVSETFFSNDEGIKGEWGVVYTDRVLPFAYKVFFTRPFEKPGYSENTCRLAYLKALFKEVIIQTLLQSDAKYGHHICKAHKLYRTGDQGLLKMDKLEVSLKYIIEEEEGDSDRSAHLLAILAKLFEILIHFYDKYDFQHNDLHAANIMTVRVGDRVANLALIDFGNSCAKIGDVEIEDLSEEDFNVLFAEAPVHVSARVVALFETLAALPQESSYEMYLAKIVEALQLETAWESAWAALGASIVDARAKFKADFNAALAGADIPEGGLQHFIDTYVDTYRKGLHRGAGRRRATRRGRKTRSRKTRNRK
jgi:hypothetical protein